MEIIKYPQLLFTAGICLNMASFLRCLVISYLQVVSSKAKHKMNGKGIDAARSHAPNGPRLVQLQEKHIPEFKDNLSIVQIAPNTEVI